MSGISENVLNKISNISRHYSQGKRYPHKPLLILIVLGRFQSGDFGPIKYSDIEERLSKLIEEYGPSRSKPKPYYPFWHLQNDEIWHVHAKGEIRLSDSSPRSSKELIDKNAEGILDKDIVKSLREDKSLIADCARKILEINFPESLRQDIANETGLDLNTYVQKRKGRDPNFRNNVLKAYNYHCAVCEKQIRLNDQTICLEAAHIKWDSLGGPSETENGIALCTLHHKLFDLGAFTINESFRVVVSESIERNIHSDECLHRFGHKDINLPYKKENRPNVEYLRRHNQKVFKA